MYTFLQNILCLEQNIFIKHHICLSGEGGFHYTCIIFQTQGWDKVRGYTPDRVPASCPNALCFKNVSVYENIGFCYQLCSMNVDIFVKLCVSKTCISKTCIPMTNCIVEIFCTGKQCVMMTLYFYKMLCFGNMMFL